MEGASSLMLFQGYVVMGLFTIAAYIIGSIPFGLIVSIYKNVNLRKVGSGNIGASNVYRALGFKWAFLVFFLDFLKGFLPTFWAMQTGEPLFHIIIGFATIIGHSLTVFANFKGGKGIATGAGVLIAIHPLLGLSVISISFLLIKVIKMVAPVTLIASLVVPIALYVLASPQEYVIGFSIMSAFIIWRHRSNITRMFEGKENKI